MKFGTKMQKAAGCETNNLGGKGGIFDGNAKLFSILIYIFFLLTSTALGTTAGCQMQLKGGDQ